MSCLALVGILLKEGRPCILQIVQVELKQTKNEKRKSSHGCCSRVAPTSKHFLKDYCDSCTKFLFILLIVYGYTNANFMQVMF